MMAWLMADTLPDTVASIGSLFQYKPEMAPAGAGTRCLTDCPVERACPYSARRLYLECPQRWAANIWHDSGNDGATDEQKRRLLSDPSNPHGRCVYRCGIAIVDHQAVMVGFQNGATGTFCMRGTAVFNCSPITSSLFSAQYMRSISRLCWSTFFSNCSNR